ncbi:GspH/FimT family pseudopilin [Leeia oryzae]|uniref:GspH/FimT family pseudopilin n=1 Tax=Leeia oryzae TaxID=356662 RepID=UPI00052515A3|nr:GspH/FimT family pseudopilin [Leeia oryzae]
MPITQHNECQHGFSMIELMIAIAVFGILLMIAIPSFNDLLLSSRLKGYANDMVASSYLARSEAIKRNQTMTLCMSSNGASCAATGDWSQGWVLLRGTTVVQVHAALKDGYSLKDSSNLTSLTFQPTGYGATQATFTLCKLTPEVGNQERVITISATGKPSVTRTSTGSCS